MKCRSSRKKTVVLVTGLQVTFKSIRFSTSEGSCSVRPPSSPLNLFDEAENFRLSSCSGEVTLGEKVPF